VLGLGSESGLGWLLVFISAHLERVKRNTSVGESSII
jgi:hypothetical protein